MDIPAGLFILWIYWFQHSSGKEIYKNRQEHFEIEVFEMRGAPPVIYQDIQQRYQRSNNKNGGIDVGITKWMRKQNRVLNYILSK